MKAVVYEGVRDVRWSEVADARILDPRDAVVRVVAAAICGSDLWSYRGEPTPARGSRAGHEFVGVIESVGSACVSAREGAVVVSPFRWSDGTCAPCRHGVTSACESGGFFSRDSDGAQGELVRVPFADATLVEVPGEVLTDDALRRDVLALADVFGTGHHAAVSAGVDAGSTVVIVGDGAVGLSAVEASRRLGAERIVLMSRNAQRTQIGWDAGATDIVPERGTDGIAAVRELLGGGADSVLECVGSALAFESAIELTRPGGAVGFVGIPHGVDLPVDLLFRRNITVAGGLAPVRATLEELLDDVLAGTVHPGRVLTMTLPMASAAVGYAAMDARETVKVLLSAS